MIGLRGLVASVVVLMIAPAAAQEVRPLSARHLSVVVGPSLNPTDPSLSWTITSADDPDWTGALAPSEVGHRTRAAELIPEGWPYPSVLEHEVFLALPQPMQPGSTYTVDAGDGLHSASFTLDPPTTLAPSVHLNQVGYLPDAQLRYAYVSSWMGTLGPMVLPQEERRFSVVNTQTGATVHEGELGLRRAAGSSTPEDVYGQEFTLTDVYEADLSPITDPGRYAVVLAGVGRSHEFDVDPAVYDEPFRTVFRALYHQRCGQALSADHTDWPHGLCHQDLVHRTDADYHLVGSDAFGALPAAATNETVAALGGYHDAGDYDRRIEHLDVVDALLDLYEIDPERFSWDDAGLPFSGNGVPDVIDESRFAIDLYRQLQEESGGVSAGVETTGYPPWGAMPEDDAPKEGGEWTWYAYASDPISSMHFAAVAARLSRALEGIDEADAARLLEEAERAWAWAREQGALAGYSEGAIKTYAQRGAQAAAELLATTGEAEYDVAFAELGPFSTGLDFSLADWDDGGWIPALWAYARAEEASTAFVLASTRVIEDRAFAWIDYAEQTAFRFTKHAYAPIGYGTASTPMAEGAGLMLRAHALTGRPEFEAWAIATCDMTLGGNPTGWSWVTGLGEGAVMRPLHNPSMGDGIDAPVPGLTVFGPMDDESSNGILGSVIAAYDPPIVEWPQLERYADVGYVPPINEFTTHSSIATTAFAFGYLASLERGPEGDDDDSANGGDDDDDDSADEESEPGCGCSTAGTWGAWWAVVLVLGRRRR